MGFDDDDFVDLDDNPLASPYRHVTVLKNMAVFSRLPSAQVQAFFSALLKITPRDADHLRSHKNARLMTGLGTYSVSVREARYLVNPKTRRYVYFSRRTVVKFKAGADLSSKVN